VPGDSDVFPELEPELELEPVPVLAAAEPVPVDVLMLVAAVTSVAVGLVAKTVIPSTAVVAAGA